jgi:hypothetical protein
MTNPPVTKDSNMTNKNADMTHDPQTYAYVVTDHDCDGVTDSVYSPETFAAQTYHDASEASGMTRETFEAYVLARLTTFERGHWESHGYVGTIGGERFRLPRDMPTVRDAGDPPPPQYVTEDGVTVREGDKVYNYYDMVPGTIGSPAFDSTWFRFLPDEPGVSGGILNGQRICTMAFAKARGFRGA